VTPWPEVEIGSLFKGSETHFLSQGAGFRKCKAVMHKQNLRIISRSVLLQLNTFYLFFYLSVDLFVFLGTSAKLRKATISFAMSVRPPVRSFIRMEQLGSTVRIFMKLGIWTFFENLSRKLKFH